MIKPIFYTLLCLTSLSAVSSFAGVRIIQSGEAHLVLTAYEETAQHLYDSLKISSTKIDVVLPSGQKYVSSVKKYATLDQSFNITCSADAIQGFSSLFGIDSGVYKCTANLFLAPQDQSTDDFTIPHRLAGDDLSLLYTTFGMYKEFRQHSNEAQATVEAGQINSGVNFSCHLVRGRVNSCQINMQKPFTAEELGPQAY